MVVMEERMNVVKKENKEVKGEKYSIEYRIVKRMGEKRWMEKREKEMKGENKMVMGIVKDVKERKKEEEKKDMV